MALVIWCVLDTHRAIHLQLNWQCPCTDHEQKQKQKQTKKKQKQSKTTTKKSKAQWFKSISPFIVGHYGLTSLLTEVLIASSVFSLYLLTVVDSILIHFHHLKRLA